MVRTSAQPKDLLCESTHLHFLRVGAGEDTVVFVHGWSAFKEIWWSAMLAVAPHARAFAPDLPGHGGSIRQTASDMGEIATRVAAFCAARGLARVTLVGHSMGGNIAAELALTRPDLVARLVLVNPAIQGRDMPGYTRSYLRSHQGWLALRTSLVLARQFSTIGAKIPHVHSGGLFAPVLRRFRYMAAHDPEQLHRLLGAMFRNPLLDRLPAIQQPTLVIAGRLDPLVPTRLSRRVAEAIPLAHLQVMPNAAHNPMDEQPVAFASLLLSFLGYGPTAS
jgi:pimeloyl-ACP methyl ester carboxylesterase